MKLTKNPVFLHYFSKFMGVLLFVLKHIFISLLLKMINGFSWSWSVPLTFNWERLRKGKRVKFNGLTRDAKGGKVSGNFGNFPWTVSGILKGWEFLEILGISNFDFFSTFYEIVCTKINGTEFFLYTIFKHTCSALLFWQFVGLYGSIERTTRLYHEITLDLIRSVFIKLNILCFSTLFLGFQKKPQIQKNKKTKQKQKQKQNKQKQNKKRKKKTF